MFPIRVPHNSRALLEIMALYDSQAGLRPLLDRVDMSGLNAANIFRMTMQSPIDVQQSPWPLGDYNASADLVAALESQTFQENIIGYLLRAFPEKRRDIFLHIPKCGGTDLITNLEPRSLSISKRLEDTAWTSKASFFAEVAKLIQKMPFFDNIFVHGHITIYEYNRFADLRPGDSLFSVLRDPVDQLLSQANYAVSRLVMDPAGRSPDTRQTLNRMGLASLPEGLRDSELREIALGLLKNREHFISNPICRHLSGVPGGNYETTIKTIMLYDIELTTMAFYNRWLHRRFGVNATTHHNASTKYLGRDDILAVLADELPSLIGEDQKVFDVVHHSIMAHKHVAIRGAGLARALGSAAAISSLPETIAAQRGMAFPERILDADGLSNISVTMGLPAVSNYLRNHPAHQGTALGEIRVASHVMFGQTGNCAPFIREGWSAAERSYRWATGPKSVLVFPTPDDPRDYQLEIDCEPYIIPNLLPNQRVIIHLNGELIGSADLSERALLRIDLPWLEISRHTDIVVTLDLPKAACPRVLTGVQDDRTLGIMVRSCLIAAYPGLGAAPA